MLTAAHSITMVGVMVGSTLFGLMSDKFGRKITFFIALISQFVIGMAIAVSPNIWVFIVLRFLIGACISGVALVAYVMGN